MQLSDLEHKLLLWSFTVQCNGSRTHCSTAMSTRPAWHSGFFAWFMLLWPRHDHFSSRINFKRVQFWKSNQFVVTGLHLWIIYRGHCSHVWQQSKGFITKIVTRTEILAPVSLLLGTNFKWYRPILGDMLNWWIIRGDLLLLIMLQSKVLYQKMWPRLKFWHWSL